MKKIDIDDLALHLHNNSDEYGLQCWELDHIYKNFYECRMNELLRDFKMVVEVLSKTEYMSEWRYVASVKNHFEHLEPEKSGAYSYMLEGARSSMSVQYVCRIDWPSNTIKIKRFEYKQVDGQWRWVLEESFELKQHASDTNLTYFKRNSLFSSWFYTLFSDMKHEKLI